MSVSDDVPVVILAGGFGTRLGNLTETLPKPLIEIGQKPILWHIMKTYFHQGFKNFIILGGYKSDAIKKYFLNYKLMNSNVQVDFSSDSVIYFGDNNKEDWKVTILDTGINSLTGTRLRAARNILSDYKFFHFTYGDGLSTVSVNENLLELSNDKDAIGIITAVPSISRFGKITLEKNVVSGFVEKKDDGLINAGYFTFRTEILDLLPNNDFSFESEFLPRIVLNRKFLVKVHNGFWHCIDNPQDLHDLTKIWSLKNPPWKIW